MDVSEKVRENRIRRMADRQELILRKSRRRDPRATDYGSYSLVTSNNALVLGKRPTLDEIEAWLTGDREEGGE